MISSPAIVIRFASSIFLLFLLLLRRSSELLVVKILEELFFVKLISVLPPRVRIISFSSVQITTQADNVLNIGLWTFSDKCEFVKFSNSPWHWKLFTRKLSENARKAKSTTWNWLPESDYLKLTGKLTPPGRLHGSISVNLLRACWLKTVQRNQTKIVTRNSFTYNVT